VTDVRAGEILSVLRGVGPFAEVRHPPEDLLRRYPAVRTWIGWPKESIPHAKLPAQEPVVIDKPLNAHLLAVRSHLPDKLPAGWSPPLAITEAVPDSAWKHGAWLIHADALCIVAALTRAQGRADLMVLLFHPDGTSVSEGRASNTLRHFQGIDEFAQTECGPAAPSGARRYLGQRSAKAARCLPN
jgi:hypothetical protein